VLERAEGTPSLVTSLSLVTELSEDRIDDAVTNGVHWGTLLASATALSHFLELGIELELLVSRRNVDLTEDQVNALWT
jgi:hypothetical protein